MKRSELVALITMLSLIAITVGMSAIILYSRFYLDSGFLNIALVAGAVAALSQMLVSILAYWGLKLTRQTYELAASQLETSTPATSDSQGPSLDGAFRMSAPDDVTNDPRKGRKVQQPISYGRERYPEIVTEVRTLETGFQRTVVILAASFMLIAAAFLSYLLYRSYSNFNKDQSQIFHIAKIDPLIFTIAVGVAGSYLALFMMARVRRETEGFGEAVSGLLTLALPGAIAVAAGVTLSWMGVKYASEIAAGVVVLILVIQALELFVNAIRSYSGVEELDLEPVDLQATPLVPMLSSVWINGLRMLMGQSFGVSGDSERGVISRMMPRVLVAVVILAIGASCVHVVPVGHMAVLERFGSVKGYDQGCEAINAGLLEPGVHVLLPWPMDKLVLVPNKRVQECDVGAEIESKKGMEDLELWNIPHAKSNEDGQFITGNVNDMGKHVGRILESYGKIWWRVSDPGKYYMALSHSDAFEANKEKDAGTTALPMNELMIARIANRALTRAFAEADGDRIMLSGRDSIEMRVREFLEKDLERLNAGIEIVGISINDMHPPYGSPDETAGKLGPAGAFEDLVAAELDMETWIHIGRLDADNLITDGRKQSTNLLSSAGVYSINKVLNAQGNAGYQMGTIDGYRENPFAAATRQRFLDLMDALAPNQKVLLGPGVEPPIIIEEGKGPGATPLGP